MARIRTIKPETWQDEKLSSLCRDARLLFIGLWGVADDEGRLRGHPALVKASVFPYDDDLTSSDIAAHLVALEERGFLLRYEADGQSFIWIKNFNKHQKIDHPSKSALPPPPTTEATLSRASREDSRIPREASRDPRKDSRETRAGKEGKGMEGRGSRAGAREASASTPSASLRECDLDLPPDLPPQLAADPGFVAALTSPPEADDEGPPLWPGPWAAGLVARQAERPPWHALVTLWLDCRRHEAAQAQELADVPDPPPKPEVLARALAQAGNAEAFRRAWLVWLADPWAAKRRPAFASSAFLSGKQLPQMLAAAQAGEFEFRADGDLELVNRASGGSAA